MPERLFFELDIDKRNRIFDAGLREFAEQNYNEASTNNIVKAAGISKGSLFKYFKNKEDIYFFILDSVIENLFEEIKEDITNLKGDIFEIIIRYAEIEFNWHINNPDKYRLFKRAFIVDNSDMYRKTIDRYKVAGDSAYYNLLKDVDKEKLKWGKDKTINIIKWIIEGFNNEFTKKNNKFSDVNVMKNAYIKEINEYMEIIKKGIYI
ncbi:UNVERIFIED_CONTAM: TetR family transcriptional regulator [Acetivibrio alkalicellulosi]